MRDVVWHLRRLLRRGRHGTPYLVVHSEYRGGHRVFLRFADVSEGEIDLGPLIDFKGPVFAPLTDEAEFARVYLDREAGTIAWPTGADWDPETLYEYVTGIELPGHDHTPEARDEIRAAAAHVRDRRIGATSR